MADVFTLTPQPVRITAITRQPIYLSMDMSGYDALDVELVCFVEGTATNAAINLVTGMQTQTEDGWVIPPNSFPTISGTGQQVARVTVAGGFLQYIRWDVSALGGATAITLFVRGIARRQVSGAVSFPLTDSASGIGQAQTYGIALVNTSTAASGAGSQQYSPGFQFTGQQWNGSASVAVDWMVQERPVSGNTIPGQLVFWSRYNGGAWASSLAVTPNASFTTLDTGTTDLALMANANLYFQINGATKAQLASTFLQPYADKGISSGVPGNSWSNNSSYWYSAPIGAQLTAAATITPTTSIHHVTGATTINIIATTNLPTSGNVFITLIADSTINFGSSASTGGIKTAPAALTSGKAMKFVFDSATSLWYAIQGG